MERRHAKPPQSEPGHARRSAQRSPTEPKVHPGLQLQRDLGNHSLSALLQARLLQTKLKVGEPGDEYEQEADRVADEVMRMPEPTSTVRPRRISSVQRKCKECEEEEARRQPREEEEEELQMQPAGGLVLQRQMPEPEPEPTEEEELQTTPLQRDHMSEEPEEKPRIPLTHHEEEDEDRGPSGSPHMQRQPMEEEPEEPEMAQTLRRQEEAEEEPEEEATPAMTASLQRQPMEEEPEGAEEDMLAQTSREGASAPTVSPALESRINSSLGRGRPLPPETRAFFEPRFGRDLEAVRLHTGASAAAASRDLKARAFTVGRDIFFGEAQYRPQSAQGQRLLAHELTHVVQQRRGASISRLPPYNRTNLAEDLAVQRAPVAEPEVEPADQGPPAAPEGGPPGGDDEETLSAEAEVETEEEQEIEIPGVELEESECFQIVPESAFEEESESDSAEGGDSDEGFAQLLEMAASAPGFTSFFGPLGLPLSLAGRAATWGWQQLPFSVRAWVINQAIDLALAGSRFMPSALLGGLDFMGRWIKAGIEGFMRRLKREDDATKVRLFERYLTIFFGGNTQFTIGYLKGLLRGFFVDGLIGIIQMVIDIVCLVLKIPQFIEALKTFFGVFPEEMERLGEAVRELGAEIRTLAANAASEVLEFLSDPAKILGLLRTAVTEGERAAGEMGEKTAGLMIRFMSQPAQRLGKTIGRAAGIILFEIVLAVITGGAGLGATAAKVTAKVLLKVFVRIGRQIWGVLQFIKPWLLMFKNFFGVAKKFLTRGARAVADRLQRVLRAIDDFFAAIFKRCRPGSMVCTVETARYVLGPRSRLINRATRRLIGRILKNGADIGLDAATLRTIISTTRAGRSSIPRMLKHLDILAKRKIPGSARVIGDLTVGGTKSQGARFVLRYIDETGAWKNVSRFEFEAAAGGRRWDAILRRTRYQIKDWGTFKKKVFAEQIVQDLRLTGLNRLKWVFNSRLGSKREIIETMTEVLLDPKYGIPRAQARRIIAKLSRIVITH